MQTEGSCLQLFTHKYTKETSPVCINADDAHLMHLTIRISVWKSSKFQPRKKKLFKINPSYMSIEKQAVFKAKYNMWNWQANVEIQLYRNSTL